MNISCALTVPQIRAQIKTASRRHVDTWQRLKVGDILTTVEKGQGIPKGGKVVPINRVEVISVRAELLLAGLDEHELRLEGFEPRLWNDWPRGMESGLYTSVLGWAVWWANAHGYKAELRRGRSIESVPCRRIEWRYLDEEETT